MASCDAAFTCLLLVIVSAVSAVQVQALGMGSLRRTPALDLNSGLPGQGADPAAVSARAESQRTGSFHEKFPFDDRQLDEKEAAEGESGCSSDLVILIVLIILFTLPYALHGNIYYGNYYYFQKFGKYPWQEAK